jgi:3-methylfumaryl-CoA hydratase
MDGIAIDVEFLKSWEGREQSLIDELNPFPCRALAAALDRDDLMRSGDTLPTLWHWLYFLEAPRADGTGLDGHPNRGGFLPPVALARRMWAGGRVEVHDPLILGVSAEKVTRIRSIEVKQGRSGILVFVTLDHCVYQEGKLRIQEEQQIVYRDISAVKSGVDEAAPSDGGAQWTTVWKIDPVLLFRFSALTYNAHRIHYDRDYATSAEYYPGLVVHGPLLAILLAEQCLHEYPERRIAEFSFRGVRPTFQGESVRLCGHSDGATASLWSVGDGDRVGMTAVVKWIKQG